METYSLNKDISVFYQQVKTFPLGIKEAFEKLIALGGNTRGYYGISHIDEQGVIVYKAAAEELTPGEAGKYALESETIRRGEYLVTPVINWMAKTDLIKNVFEELMNNERVDTTMPCVEWYKTDKEMWCMMKLK